jgi:hypothetical protein
MQYLIFCHLVCNYVTHEELSYLQDQGTWTTAQTSQLTNHRKSLDLQVGTAVQSELRGVEGAAKVTLT